MIKSIISTIASILIVVGLFSMAKSPTVSTIHFDGATPFSQEGVYAWFKAYDAAESKKYLKSNLHRDGYQPVQITIQNNTAKTYHISPESLSLPIVAANKIASRVIKDALPRSIMLKVAGFFFWPLMIPGAIDTIYTYNSYSTLKNSLKAKGVKKEQILPYTTVHRVMFVDKDHYTKNFSVALTDPKGENAVNLYSY